MTRGADGRGRPRSAPRDGRVKAAPGRAPSASGRDGAPAPPGWVTRRAAVTTRPDGRLRLGVVADTHSKPDARGLSILSALAPDGVLHGGDVGDPAVLEALSAIAPVYAVRGNIDGRTGALPDDLVLDVLTPGGARALRVLVTHVALAGPRLRGDAGQRARAHGASLVVCGHSHVPFLGASGGLTVFNPGSVGPRRFTLPIILGVLELSPDEVRLRHVDVETGQAWTPA